MADATPMFQTKASLQQALRLSGVKANTDADEQLDAAIREARTYFWRRLGLTRLNEILALSFVDPPTSDDEMLAHLAAQTERLRVRYTLLPLYAAQFKDGSSAAFEEWNQEGAFRNVNPFSSQTMAKAALVEIEANMELLSERDVAGEETTMNAVTIEPQAAADPPIVSGESVFGSSGIFGGIR